jgi:hypothetical protein
LLTKKNNFFVLKTLISTPRDTEPLPLSHKDTTAFTAQSKGRSPFDTLLLDFQFTDTSTRITFTETPPKLQDLKKQCIGHALNKRHYVEELDIDNTKCILKTKHTTWSGFIWQQVLLNTVRNQ